MIEQISITKYSIDRIAKAHFKRYYGDGFELLPDHIKEMWYGVAEGMLEDMNSLIKYFNDGGDFK